MKKAIATLIVSLFASAAFAQTPAADTQETQGTATVAKTHVKVAKKRVKHTAHKARHPLAKHVTAKKTRHAAATTQP